MQNCSRLMLKDNEKKMYLEQIQELERLGQMTDDTVNKVFAEARKNKTCPYCGSADGDQVRAAFIIYRGGPGAHR